ncbi:DUF4336 domain-containing protein [Sphingopyxis terrae subsp. ummariensis]
MSAFLPYAPLNTPKAFGDQLWIVDGPEIRMDYGPTSIPFPTRMTVVRLADGTLWVHSPIAPDKDLLSAIDRLGPIDLRLTFWPRRARVRRAVAAILSWDCERVVMAHGLPYERDGAAELRRALRWAC